MGDTKDQQTESSKDTSSAIDNTQMNIENEIKKAESDLEAKKPKVLKSNEKEDKEDYWQVWGALIQDWDNQNKKNTQYVKELVRRGIPSHFRGIAWQLLTNAQDNPVRDRYSELLRQNSPCEKIILRDIARTFPEHEFFKDKNGLGQRGLFNVLKAYSSYDVQVNYCQGSAFIVGVLLLNMPEEDAWSVFVRLMEDYRLREIFKPTMAELGLLIYQLECMVQELLPELHRHFQSQNYHCSMYASSWFLTLFTSCLPLTVAFRVVDLFLSEGLEAIFRISISILMICKEQLLRLDMENLLKFFQKQVPEICEIDPDYLIQLAMAVKFDPKKMKKLSKDYSTLKSKEQEELVELRRLRTENRLLRQRIENLEQESAELADKLIQGQVCRAEEAEDNYVIKRELSVLSQRENDLKLELEKANERIEQLKIEKKQCSAMLGEETQLVIDSIQEELIAVKLREAESHDEIKQLRALNKRLSESPPDYALQQLQDEMISVKLREAEANLAIKELKTTINNLNNMWTDHLNSVHNNSNTLNGLVIDNSQPNSLDNTSIMSNNSLTNGLPSSTHSSLSISVSSSPLKMLGNSFKKNSEDRLQLTNEISRLKQELMSAKLREAEAVAEMKDLRLRVMELETQNQVSLNQIRRQADEISRIKDQEKEFLDKEKQWASKLIDEQRKYMDLDSHLKEQQMMNRIKDLEQTQLIAELKQKVSSFEVRKEEKVTIEKLKLSGQDQIDNIDLQNRITELQLDELRLESNRNKIRIK